MGRPVLKTQHGVGAVRVRVQNPRVPWVLLGALGAFARPYFFI